MNCSSSCLCFQTETLCTKFVGNFVFLVRVVISGINNASEEKPGFKLMKLNSSLMSTRQLKIGMQASRTVAHSKRGFLESNKFIWNDKPIDLILHFCETTLHLNKSIWHSLFKLECSNCCQCDYIIVFYDEDCFWCIRKAFKIKKETFPN